MAQFIFFFHYILSLIHISKHEVKEVTKEVEVAGPRAIFFKIGSARLDDYGKVNIELAAKILKANPDKKYKVAGYADKATGSASWNQKLSEKRCLLYTSGYIIVQNNYPT